MSLCTPSRETSGPLPAPFAAILSISSMKTMPSCSALSIASRTTASMSTSFSDSSFERMRLASRTVTLRAFVFLGRTPPNISFRFRSIPIASMVSLPVAVSATSISIISSSSRPACKSLIILFRLEICSAVCSSVGSFFLTATPVSPPGVSEPNSFASPSEKLSAGFGVCFAGFPQRISTMRFSAAASAASLTSSVRFAFTRRMEASTRSRIMESTSRPT